MLLALVMVFALCACGSKTEDATKPRASKVGFICLHDENSTYDKNFIDAAKAACKNAGLSEDQYIIKTNIPEARSATTPRPSSWTPAAMSSLPTASATRTS